MALVSFAGIKAEKFRAGRAVLPKFFLEEMRSEGLEVLGKAKLKVCVSRMPRVMVEGFLKEYLEVETVVARELKVFAGYYTGFMEEEEEEAGHHDDGVSLLEKMMLLSQCKVKITHLMITYEHEFIILTSQKKKSFDRTNNICVHADE